MSETAWTMPDTGYVEAALRKVIDEGRRPIRNIGPAAEEREAPLSGREAPRVRVFNGRVAAVWIAAQTAFADSATASRCWASPSLGVAGPTFMAGGKHESQEGQ